MKKLSFLISVLLSLFIGVQTRNALAQGISVNTTGADPDPSAMLDVSGTNGGVLINRMNTEQRDAIQSPANGLMIWNISTNCLDVYIVNGWQSLSCGCSAEPATPGVINGAASICSNSVNNTYSVGAVFSAVSYTWTVPSGAVITSGQGTPSITVSAGTSSGDISVSATNSCGTSDLSALTVSVSSTPAIPVTAAAGSINCTGFTAQWNSSPGATSYYLDVATDSGFNGFVAGYNNQNVGNFQSTVINALQGNTPYYYRVRAGNFCGISENSSTVTLTTEPSTPATPGAIIGTTNACGNSTGNVYSISSVQYATSYNWTVPSGATITAGAGTSSITVTFGGTSGNISVSAVNSCGTSSQSSKAVSITNLGTLNPPSVYNGRTVFNYTGSNQTFAVPVCVSQVFVKLWGAGGGGDNDGGMYGGAGAFVSGYLPVTSGSNLTVIVGGRGVQNDTNNIPGGFGGGGATGSSPQYQGASGGGRSAIQKVSGTDAVTAGGGGGSGGVNNYQAFGGGGGAPDGSNGGGTDNGYGRGGTTTAGGATGSAGNPGTAGSSQTGGQGGNAINGSSAGGGGGGGGYFGGGGGSGSNSGSFSGEGGGGGGSSYTANLTSATNIAGLSKSLVGPNTGDVDYISGVAAGGPTNGSGGHGEVVIYW